MSLAAAFAAAASVAGSPYHPAELWWPGVATTDDGGDIEDAGTPTTLPCKAQVSQADTRMRQDAQFQERDMKILILAYGLTKAPDTDAQVTVQSGPHAGTYALETIGLDTAGVGYVGRARPI